MFQIESCTKQQIQVDDLSEEFRGKGVCSDSNRTAQLWQRAKLGKEVVVWRCKVLLPLIGLFIVLLKEVVVRSCKDLLPLKSQHKLCGV